MSNIIKLQKGNIVKSMAQRASKISDKVFDRQYFRALDSGNPRRVQAVRNLHFMGKAPDNKMVTEAGYPIHNYHGSPVKDITVFRENARQIPFRRKNRIGIYFTENKKFTSNYTGLKGRGYDVYLNFKNPLVNERPTILDDLRSLNPFRKRQFSSDYITTDDLNGALKGYDGAVTKGQENVALKSNQIKLADPITYDDAGNIIPISQRDNFSVNDIRYKEGGSIKKHQFGSTIKKASKFAPKIEQLYVPPKTSSVRTSLAFFERQPSRISMLEKSGVPKSERNLRVHGTPQAPYYDYSLINKHHEPWTVNERGQFVFDSPEKSKKLSTFHFSFNGPVVDHSMGRWSHAPIITIIPYRNVRSQVSPVDIEIMDTFFPNYNGLKISSRGSKTLTGSRSAFDYYRGKGVDVEFSPEMEVQLQKLQELEGKLKPLKNSPDFDYFSPEVQDLYKQIGTTRETIDKIGREWAKQYTKPIPSFQKLQEFGRAEGYNMDKYPNALGSPIRDYWRYAKPGELDYTWATDPTNHSVFLRRPEVALQNVKNGEWDVRPEYLRFLEYAVKHGADFRKKGGVIKAENGFDFSKLAIQGINFLQSNIKNTQSLKNFDEETDATIQSMKIKQYADNYAKAIQQAQQEINQLNNNQEGVHYGTIDLQHLAQQISNSMYDNSAIEEYKAQRAKEKAAIQGSATTNDFIQSGLGMLGEFLNKKKPTTTSSNNDTSFKVSSFWNNPTLNTNKL